MRLLPAGTDRLMVELSGLSETLSLFDQLCEYPPLGLLEAIPAARTVMLRFDPMVTSRPQLAAHLATLDLSKPVARSGREIEIPVIYDGEDLAEVADHLGWSVDELIGRHRAATYTVAFTGFAPGFAYMHGDDPDFDVPRRKSPRLRIPAGSVAIAGTFCGIYPSDSPGGWQLLGRTPLAMWDLARPRPALLAPGDRVRFVAIKDAFTAPVSVSVPASEIAAEETCLTVTRSDRPALFQDRGREGRADQGVSASGALDRSALAEANLCVGNPPDAAGLEITYGGFALKAERPLVLAITGAEVPLQIETVDGRHLSAPFHHPFAIDPGESLTLEAPKAGMRSYLALRGGFSVETVLGSASTDALAKLGPADVTAGTRLRAGQLAVRAVDPYRKPVFALPVADDLVTLDIVPGPRTDWFEDEAMRMLMEEDWLVTPQSNRIGIRLSGERPLPRRITGELPSEATAPGALQVPHSGQPVLFLADHPLTGGYPVIAVVATHHLDLAGQLPIGTRVRFRPISPFDPQEI